MKFQLRKSIKNLSNIVKQKNFKRKYTVQEVLNIRYLRYCNGNICYAIAQIFQKLKFYEIKYLE